MAQTRVGDIQAVTGLFLALAWIFTGFRLYVRLYMRSNFGLDDIFLLIALAFFTALSVSSVEAAAFGIGHHTDTLSDSSKANAALCFWLGEIFYTIAGILIRVSIAIITRRLCTTKLQFSVLYGTMVILIAVSVSHVFIIIFQTSPVEYYWTRFIGYDGRFTHEKLAPIFTILLSAVSALSDWVLGILSALVVWNLNMKTRIRISVAFLVSLGMIAGVAAVIRIPYTLDKKLRTDFFFQSTDLAIWSIVEVGLGIVAAAAMTLKPLFQIVFRLTTDDTTTIEPHSRHAGYGYHAGYLRSRSKADETGRVEDIELDQTLRNKFGQTEATVTANPFNSSGTFWNESDDHLSTTSINRSGSSKQGKDQCFRVHRTVEVRRFSNGSLEDPVTSQRHVAMEYTI